MRKYSIAMMLMAGLASGAIAQSGDIMSKAINKPSINYSFYGSGYTAKVVKDAKVAGGLAYSVDVAQKGANAWDVGANAVIDKPIRKGDRIVVAVWMRAPKLSAGKTTPVPFVGVVGPAPAFKPIATGTAAVTGEWALYNGRGVAGDDYPAGQPSVALHLAAAKAVIELGPVFVLDMGQGTAVGK